MEFNKVWFENKIKVGAYPVGVDPEKFEEVIIK